MNLQLTPLNLPEYKPKVKIEKETHYVFDVLEKNGSNLHPKNG
jgi:hypothetical protein